MQWIAKFTLILILLFFSVEITAGKFCLYKKIDENGGNFVIEISQLFKFLWVYQKSQSNLLDT